MAKNRQSYHKKKFVIPLIIYVIGVVLSWFFCRLTRKLNFGEVIGYITISVGIILFLNALVQEKYRLGKKIGFPLKLIFPAYPVVPDYDNLTRELTAFKEAYNEVMNDEKGMKANNRLQSYATQLLWHCLYLKKRRLEKHKLQIDLQSNRRSYSKKSSPVRANTYFDGRYDVTDVYEEIYATRTYRQGSRELAEVCDKEVARYTFLSAKSVSPNQVVCPNCGSIATRDNLIDGCDYCGTKFTVEDLSGRVASFGFRRDFEVQEAKQQAARKALFPWVYMAIVLPLAHIGLFLPFSGRYEGDMLFQIGLGLAGAVIFGGGGFIMATIPMLMIVTLVMVASEQLSKWIPTYRPAQDWKREIQWAERVRQQDPLFSIQSFFGGFENKLYAIHFADTLNEVNAFSDCDLSGQLQNYRDVVDIETISLMLNDYGIRNGMQMATVGAILLVRELKAGKIETRKEVVRMCLEKNADCKTQAVCGPSILRCKKCGSSLSLLEGKTCRYCGNVLDLRAHDWVITRYF